MTIIAVRDGIVACDSLVSWGNLNYAHTKKMRRLPDGSILAISGDTISGATFLDYAEGAIGRGEEITPDILRRFATINCLWVREDGVYLVEGKRSGSGMIRIEGEFFAEGSGCTAALAAMHGGASARKAVAITCKVDTTCALPVQWMRLTTATIRPRGRSTRAEPASSKTIRMRGRARNQ
jgi:ATP-dependent protease HslVU (ClpYQ) peptidase subunit